MAEGREDEVGQDGRESWDVDGYSVPERVAWRVGVPGVIWYEGSSDVVGRDESDDDDNLAHQERLPCGVCRATRASWRHRPAPADPVSGLAIATSWWLCGVCHDLADDDEVDQLERRLVLPGLDQQQRRAVAQALCAPRT